MQILLSSSIKVLNESPKMYGIVAALGLNNYTTGIWVPDRAVLLEADKAAFRMWRACQSASLHSSFGWL